MWHIYHQLLHHGFNPFPPAAPLIRLATLCLLFLIGPGPFYANQILCGCTKRHCDWRSSQDWRFQFAIFKKDRQKFKNCYRCSLIIHPYRSKPDQYTVTDAVSKAIQCGGLVCSHGASTTYLDVNLTLHVRVAQREKCGSNILWVCAAPPACCTEPNASMFTHIHLHMDSSFIQDGSTPAKPFRSNHFCILEER